jgi:ABC-type dipeptide/oligopeptide/nickel transport system ATPase component
VDGVSFECHRGETLALVGESGSGKTVTSLSILRLLANSGRIVSGEIAFTSREGNHMNLAELSEREMRTVRGNQIAMVFQEPMSSLNPVYPVGDQIAESVMLHRGHRSECRSLAQGLDHSTGHGPGRDDATPDRR